jgi:hypothetical protein
MRGARNCNGPSGCSRSELPQAAQNADTGNLPSGMQATLYGFLDVSANETKRIYQLGMTVQVREAVEKSNEKAYGEERLLRFYDVLPVSETEEKEAVAK